MTFFKTLFIGILLAASAPLSRAVPFAVYEFVSLSGDVAFGRVGVSEKAFHAGAGPTVDSTQDFFTFSFGTEAGSFSYVDYMGFGYTLSEDRSTLFTDGNLISFFPTRGVATFTTDRDGLVFWTGSYNFEGGAPAATGTGRWSLVEPVTSHLLMESKSSVLAPSIALIPPAQVPDSGSTFLLLGISLCALPIYRVLIKARLKRI